MLPDLIVTGVLQIALPQYRAFSRSNGGWYKSDNY